MDRQIEIEGTEQRRSPRWWRMMSVVVVALVLGVLMSATLVLAAPSAAPAAANLEQSVPDHDGDDEHDGDYIVKYGIVISRPEEKVGTWVISNTEVTSYTVTDETLTEGDLPVGACVEVKSLESDPTTALKIRAKEAEHCNHDDDDDHDEEISRHGVIVSRPVESVGLWIIGEKTFSVTESTILEGVLEVGSCVEVKSLASDPATAIKIEAKDAFKCVNDDDIISRHGVIVSRPVESVGVWIIGEKSFTVTEQTVLEGVLEIGACVEVKSLKSDPATAIKIEAKDPFKCGDDDDDDDHHGDWIVNYGRLESRPDGKIGTWVIGGVAYTATEHTDFDFDHGRLVVGVCVKVKVHSSNPTVAKEIESEKDYKCGDRDDDDNAHGTLYGVIEELPTDLMSGTWLIGGISFVVSPTTELITKGIPVTVGLTVKVDFTTNMSDTNFARRIEIKFGQNNPCRLHDDDHDAAASHNGGDDHRRYGDCPGREGKTIGRIDSRPQGTLLGQWMIGGVPYVMTAYTKFFPNDDFLTGERVKVEYVVLSDNLRYATKVNEIGSGIPGNPNASLIVGYVDEKPEAFVGDWVINGAPFVAVSDTIFIERGSLFAVGAYVVVEYEITDNVRLIKKILTYVPPGAGDQNVVGQLQSIGSVTVASEDELLQDGEVWTVDGVDYIVTEATQLVDSGGDLTEGATVFVNSYTADGQRYATLIRTQGGKMFLPQAGRD